MQDMKDLVLCPLPFHLSRSNVAKAMGGATPIIPFFKAMQSRMAFYIPKAFSICSGLRGNTIQRH